MSGPMYIETGPKRITQKRTVPIVVWVSKLKNFFLLAAEYDGESDKMVARRTRKELTDAGLTYFQLDRRESRHIAHYLHADEHIKGAIRGHMKNVGKVLIAATESRVVYLHEIPLFSNFEEFPYDIVTGISINNVSHILSSVSIFTKFKTYELDYVNIKAAEKFVAYVEARIYSQAYPSELHEGERRLPMQQQGIVN